MDSVRDSVWDSVWDSVYGQHDSSWLAFFDFFNRIGMENETKPLKGDFLLAKSAGWALPHKNICWVSERTSEVHFNANNQIHNTKGPAIAYPDGFEIHALNGVRVPAFIVKTDANKLDPRIVLEQTNAEIRREIVRKIGVERLIQKIGAKQIDSWNGYELLKIHIPNMQTDAIYLKMRNPSIGTWHVEGVPPNIKTCQQALSWRVGGKEWQPEQLT